MRASGVAMPLVVLAALVTAVTGSACGSDHSGLERKDAASASAGAGGAASSATTSVATSGAGGEPSEPEVPTSLTIVNGVVDEEAVRLCLVRYPEGPVAEAPWPSGAGLAFARGAQVDLASLSLGGGDLDVRVVLGSAASVGAKSCKALEDAPGVRVVSLGVVPASVLEAKRRLVFVAHGCVGGPGREDPSQALACGKGYTATTPTLGLVAAALSGLGAPGALRLQALHAVSGLEAPSKVSVSPGVEPLAYQSLEGAWTLGALAPTPPLDTFSVADLGDVAAARLAVAGNAGTVELDFAEALANGGVSVASLVDGDGLAFVGVGASPGLTAGSWYRAFTMVALRASN
ncbi:MAG: hypothetical protein FJ095_21425 [Deltaproteobacteria bacterium]|nr:hypothetical protein [Deltaproteobacteria bacterium]